MKEPTAYRNAWGWFTFPDLYEYIIDKIPEGGSFAELGVYQGRSILFFAEMAEIKGKDIKIFGIDHFEGTPGDDIQKHLLEGTDLTLKEWYFQNIKDYSDKIQTVIDGTDQALQRFEDDSLDAVFIDADHNYEPVKNDIKNWVKKVKVGGILAGHDYYGDHPGVKQAVDELLKGHGLFTGRKNLCWWIEVSQFLKNKLEDL